MLVKEIADQEVINLNYEFLNKSFEKWTGGSPDNWQEYGYYGGSQKQYSWVPETDSSVVIDGSKCLKMGCWGYNSNCILTQEIDPKGYLGRTIPITIWACGSANGNTRFDIQSDGQGGSGSKFYYPTIQYAWEQIGGDYTVAEDATFLRVRLFQSRNTPSWGYNWFDHLEIPEPVGIGKPGFGWVEISALALLVGLSLLALIFRKEKD